MNLNQIKTGQLEGAIGYVTQKPTILHGTIYENICMKADANDLSGDERLTRAISLSGFDKVMKQNNLELTTLVEPAGINLSIGQEQKLAICRAIYLGEEVIVFDEPTSAFDSLSEYEFFL